MQTIDKKSTTLETLADLFRDAFEEWLSGLDMERPALSEQSKKTLAESMRASMAWRDSILVSATCSNSSEYDAVKLKGFAFHREHEEWLGRMISGSLKDETLDEDRTVCRRAVGMLFDIVEAVEDIDIELQAQPLAVISYLLWWMGAPAPCWRPCARSPSTRSAASPPSSSEPSTAAVGPRRPAGTDRPAICQGVPPLGEPRRPQSRRSPPGPAHSAPGETDPPLRSGTIPTTERAPPCPCAAGPGNGAARDRAAIGSISLPAVCLRQGS